MTRTYLLDLDGTMYRGSQIIKEAKIFLDYLIKTNQKFIFLTNNAKRTRKQNVEHMKVLGFTGITEDHFFTSAMAASKQVAMLSENRKCFFIGEAGLRQALQEEGFIFVQEDADFVFVGLQQDATYELYSKALSLLLKGAKLVGTNDDRKIPIGDDYMIGNGAIVEMLAYASGQTSWQIGKPHPPILRQCLSYYNLSKNEVVMIGDNLETDILMCVNQQVESILVCTGVHNEKDIAITNIHPSRVIQKLTDLIK